MDTSSLRSHAKIFKMRHDRAIKAIEGTSPHEVGEDVVYNNEKCTIIHTNNPNWTPVYDLVGLYSGRRYKDVPYYQVEDLA